jgi:plastocyanin
MGTILTQWYSKIMKSNTIIYIVIAVAVIGAGVFFMNRKEDASEVANIQPNPTLATASGAPLIQTAPSTSPDATTVDSIAMDNPTVSMTDAGISPAEITIKAGATVTFVNNGQVPHWPASDPHPIHTDLSGFDAKRGLNPGELYRFTFTKIGSFGMHDHLHPAFKGRIIVQ